MASCVIIAHLPVEKLPVIHFGGRLIYGTGGALAIPPDRSGQPLRLTRHDGPEMPVSEAELLAQACAHAGRQFVELEKSLEIQILVAPDRAALRQRLRDIIALAPADQSLDEDLRALLDGETDKLPAALAQTWICGTPDEAAQRIQEYVAVGITHFMLWFVDAPRLDSIRLFAEQIAPRFHYTARSGFSDHSPHDYPE